MRLKMFLSLIIFSFYLNLNIYCEEETSFNLSFENNRTFFPSKSSTWMKVNLSPEEKEKKFRYELTVSDSWGNMLYQPEIPVTFLKKGGTPYIRYEINLSSEIKKLLYEYDPDFQILNYDDYSEELISLFPITPYNTPSVVVGDFNGDNREDILMIGKKISNKHIEKEIVILSTNTTNNYIILTQWEAKYPPQKIGDEDSISYSRISKKKYAYLFQPRGSRYICGGDYAGKSMETLKRDGYALIEGLRDGKLWFTAVYQWDDNTKKFEPYCSDMWGYYYIPVYVSLRDGYYEYYQENSNKPNNKQ